jgi:hypothetical protein
LAARMLLSSDFSAPSIPRVSDLAGPSHVK